MKIKLRNIKKWKTIDPDELLKAYEARTPKAEPTIKDEAAWVDDMNRLAGKQERQSHIRTKETADPDKLKFLVAYGEYHPRTYVDLSKEEIGRIATKIQQDIETKKVAKVRDIFKKVILANKTKYLTEPAKPTIGDTDWVSDSPVLTKAILNIRESTQPKFVLTPAGKAKDIKRISAEASAFKIARQRAETFKTEAAKSGYSVERIGDLEKKFLKKSKLIKAPVTSETSIDLGFPGKGTGYDPFGIGTANEILIEFGAMPKGNPKLRHPFQRRNFKSEKDFEVAKDRWKNIPVRGTFIKHRPDQPFPEVIKVTGHTKHKGYISRKPDPRADQIFAGQKATRIVGTGRLTPSDRIIPEVEWQKHKTKWFKAQPKRTKPEIGYAVTKSEWTRNNKRLENEFLKGLERRKGPFHWE